MGRKNLVIRGEPRVGKSTLVREAVMPYSAYVGGVLTEEILQDGERIGFLARSFDGRTARIARVSEEGKCRGDRYVVDLVKTAGGTARIARVSCEGERIVGRYVVDLVKITTVVTPWIITSLDLPAIIIDEIAGMQLTSRSFQNAVLGAFMMPELPVLATMHTAPHEFSDMLLRRSDVRVIDMTAENRDEVADVVRRWLAARLPPA